ERLRAFVVRIVRDAGHGAVVASIKSTAQTEVQGCACARSGRCTGVFEAVVIGVGLRDPTEATTDLTSNQAREPAGRRIAGNVDKLRAAGIVLRRSQTLGVADGVGDGLSAGISHGSYGAVEIVGIGNRFVDARNGAGFCCDSSSGVVGPGGCARTVTHGGAMTFRSGVCQ